MSDTSDLSSQPEPKGQRFSHDHSISPCRSFNHHKDSFANNGRKKNAASLLKVHKMERIPENGNLISAFKSLHPGMELNQVREKIKIFIKLFLTVSVPFHTVSINMG